MRYPWLHDYLMAKPAVTQDFKAEWRWIRYMIGGKMFVAVCLDENDAPYYITLKLKPEDGQILRATYEDVIPGYYCNKVHWNSVRPDGAVPDEVLRAMVDASYALVLGGFSKARQKALLGS